MRDVLVAVALVLAAFVFMTAVVGWLWLLTVLG